jgi:hypothetical protein
MLLPLIFACERSEPDSSSGVQANAYEAQVTSLESENRQLRDTIERLRDEFVTQLEPTLKEKGAAIWGCDDVHAAAVIKKTPMVGSNLPALIAALNQVHAAVEQPLLQLQGLERDTAVVTVNDPTLLTHRMGSTGAMCYLAGATFTLTSIKGIDSVWFDIPEGDHASPGRYDRATYIDMIHVTQK